MGKRPAAGESEAGFTLIEIMIVVTIIILVFGFAAPTLNSYMSNQKLKAVTGRLAQGFSAGRMRAITKHQDMYVIFFADRLMIASSRLEVPELYEYFSSAREASKIRILFRFADASVEEKASKNHPFGIESDLPPLPPEDWTQPVTARSVLESGVLEGKVAFVIFRSDGTAEFSRTSGPGDRLSVEFWANPPRDADVIVEEQGNPMRGWIDVRPTGNVDMRMKEGELRAAAADESSTEEGAEE
jgi:prepilin-type N-terminal cleavage/methylation domain-containing protein